MQYNFPEILTSRTSEEQATKIVDEIEEFREELSDEEAIDVLHATETFLRVHFKGREDILDGLIKQVVDKNTKRGYYKVTCF